MFLFVYLGLWCLDGLGLICLWRGIVVAAADLGCFTVGEVGCLLWSIVAYGLVY